MNPNSLAAKSKALQSPDARGWHILNVATSTAVETGKPASHYTAMLAKKPVDTEPPKISGPGIQ